MTNDMTKQNETPKESPEYNWLKHLGIEGTKVCHDSTDHYVHIMLDTTGSVDRAAAQKASLSALKACSAEGVGRSVISRHYKSEEEARSIAANLTHWLEVEARKVRRDWLPALGIKYVNVRSTLQGRHYFIAELIEGSLGDKEERQRGMESALKACGAHEEGYYHSSKCYDTVDEVYKATSDFCDFLGSATRYEEGEVEVIGSPECLGGAVVLAETGHRRIADLPTAGELQGVIPVATPPPRTYATSYPGTWNTPEEAPKAEPISAQALGLHRDPMKPWLGLS